MHEWFSIVYFYTCSKKYKSTVVFIFRKHVFFTSLLSPTFLFIYLFLSKKSLFQGLVKVDQRFIHSGEAVRHFALDVLVCDIMGKKNCSLFSFSPWQDMTMWEQVGFGFMLILLQTPMEKNAYWRWLQGFGAKNNSNCFNLPESLSH